MHSWTMICCTKINSQSTLQSAPFQLLHGFKAPFINSFGIDNLIVCQDTVLVSFSFSKAANAALKIYVKSLSIAEWGNTMVIEPMAH